MESAAEVLVTFGGFKRRVCVAGVALCDIPTCFISCQNSFCVTGASASFSDDDFLIFVWQVQHGGSVHVQFAWQAQHFRRVVLRVERVFANLMLRAALSGDDVPNDGIVRVPFCVASASLGADLSCVECHFAWQAQYRGHSTLHALHFTLRTLHFALYTPHFTLHNVHLTLFTAECNLHSTLYSLHFKIYTPQFTLDT